MKHRRQTPKPYAEKLYQLERCTGRVAAYSDRDIIDARVRAFLDGVAWAKRRSAKG